MIKLGDKVVRTFDLYRGLDPVIATVTHVSINRFGRTVYKLNNNVRFIDQSYISKYEGLKLA